MIISLRAPGEHEMCNRGTTVRVMFGSETGNTETVIDLDDDGLDDLILQAAAYREEQERRRAAAG